MINTDVHLRKHVKSSIDYVKIVRTNRVKDRVTSNLPSLSDVSGLLSSLFTIVILYYWL